MWLRQRYFEQVDFQRRLCCSFGRTGPRPVAHGASMTHAREFFFRHQRRATTLVNVQVGDDVNHSRWNLTMINPRYRTWLSPFTTVIFVAIAVSGVLMFFQVRFGGITVLHEFAGLLFVGAGVLHLAIHWKTLMGYFRHRTAQVIFGFALVACLALLVFGSSHQGHSERGRRGPPDVGQRIEPSGNSNPTDSSNMRSC